MTAMARGARAEPARHVPAPARAARGRPGARAPGGAAAMVRAACRPADRGRHLAAAVPQVLGRPTGRPRAVPRRGPRRTCGSVVVRGLVEAGELELAVADPGLARPVA